MMQERLNKLRDLIRANGLSAIIITDKLNRRYFSGFTGSAGALIVTDKEAILTTDFRYWEQAKEQAPLFAVQDCPNGVEAKIKELINSFSCSRIGFEEEKMSVSSYNSIQLDQVSYQPLSAALDKLRRIKTEDEIKLIRKAANIADQAFSYVVNNLKIGMTEKEVALELEYQMKRAGAENISFSSIVACGDHSALPHAEPSERKIQKGDFVKMDFGALYQGYCSDMTRTVVMGEYSEKQKEIYDIVLKAQLAALEAIRPGMMTDAIDKIARDIIKENGYGDNFGHGLGHSLGLFIHEEPRLSPKCHEKLEPGMLMTVEPGIYVPGFGGVRIEDLVLVTSDGLENLTSSPKEFLVIG